MSINKLNLKNEEEEKENFMEFQAVINRIENGDLNAIIKLSKMFVFENNKEIDLLIENEVAFEYIYDSMIHDNLELMQSSLSCVGAYFFYIEYKGQCDSRDVLLLEKIVKCCEHPNERVKELAYWILSNAASISSEFSDLLSDDELFELAISCEQSVETGGRNNEQRQARWFLCNILSLGSLELLQKAIACGLDVDGLVSRVRNRHDEFSILESASDIANKKKQLFA